MRRQIPLRGFLLAFLALAAACSVVWAQATTSVRGTLLDPAGAAVPGVEITLQNTDTAAIRTTVSDGAGRYQFLQVPPGSYRIRAEMKGFDGVAPDNVQLLVNTPLTLDLRFQIRVIVNVPAPYVPPINKVDATIGSTILNTQIVALPLEGRNGNFRNIHNKRFTEEGTYPFENPNNRLRALAISDFDDLKRGAQA